MPESSKKKGQEGDIDTSTIASESDTNLLLSEFIEERGGDLQPDENLLEVWIKGATFTENFKGGVPPGSSTFIVTDFFDYESQATSLISGNKPYWDFAATFKLSVDDFMLRYFALDAITFELNMVFPIFKHIP